MGFLTELFGTAVNLGVGALTGQPGVAAASGLIASRGAESLIGTTPAAAVRRATGLGGGNGVTHLRTVVQSIDNATGAIVRESIQEGSPFLMNKDMQIARKVFKMIGMANKRLPKKMVRVSAATMLKDQLVESSLQNAISHNHHHSGANGNG